MKFFVDTADTAEISAMSDLGLVDGVTTNPSLISKSGRNFLEIIAEIAGMVDGPVSAEVVALEHVEMMREAEKLLTLGDNIAIKVPLTADGLKTCRALSKDAVPVNVTLCFSANQALLAAKAGAAYISPFIGRHDDVGFDGMSLISDIRLIYDNYDFTTEILAASVRHPGARAGGCQDWRGRRDVAAKGHDVACQSPAHGQGPRRISWATGRRAGRGLSDRRDPRPDQDLGLRT